MDHFTAVFVYDILEQALENNHIIYNRRNNHHRLDPFLDSDARFQKNFRLSKELTNDLINVVRPFIPEKDIDLRTKVLAALNFFGTGSYQTPVGQNISIGLSQPSVSRCLEEVVTALNRPEIFQRWIKFPETQVELNRTTRDYYNMYGIPGVVGSIDCTHVACVPPDESLFDERAYVNRKLYHSINTQLVCDAHLRILNVNALFPGSTHDSFIWNNSSLRPFMEQLHQAGYTQYHLIDCLHLQLYRDPRDRFKKGQSKASLSLQQFLGFESGFTLDKESNTIAILCQDVVVALAFETRERLIAWQVKVGSQLGSSREFLVMVGSGSKRLPAGPARLHLQGRKFAMTAGVPPRLLALWELKHLRRYGVVEGRFCFEGGSHCGKNEGLHVLITDQAHEITDAFDLALHGHPALGRPGGSRKSTGERGNKNRPDTRLSDFNNFNQSIPDTASGLYEENFFGTDCGRISPLWSSDERRQSYEDFDAKPVWDDANQITLERCSNCMMKLGTSRTCNVSVTPTFNPAWKMDTVPDSSSSGNSSNSMEYLKSLRRDDDLCHCNDKPPLRPPKPYHFEPKKPPQPLPMNSCVCPANDNVCIGNTGKVGPYEDYDVPKVIHSEVPTNSEYYDTPKRLKKILAEDLFLARKESPNAGPVVLNKTCGCVLKLASQKKPVIVECEESLQPTECPCQKVTNWANNLIGLPYCKKTPNTSKVKTEILEVVRDISDQKAIYATIDISRKTNRQSGSISEKDNILSLVSDDTILQNYENIEPVRQEEINFCANYENLEFSLSLEHYENAKHLLKKAGVTQNELDALSSKMDAPNTLPKKSKLCTKCVHCQNTTETGKKNKSDEYLLMGPSDSEKETCQSVVKNLGYTPMCPNPNWSHSLKHPQSRNTTMTSEKYVSSPTLHSDNILFNPMSLETDTIRIENRSSTADSEVRLDDLNECDSSIASHVTSSSLETLRNMTIDVHHQDSSSNEGASCTPPMRNKLMDSAQIKRSSSVPCKNRDSSSSNDSGVSSCSMKQQEFEAPITSIHSGHKYMVHKKLRGNLSGCLHSSLPRKSKSSDPLRDKMIQIHVPAKSSSAEAEVPVLPPKQFKGIVDTHSTSSGTSDMSDYFETLSISSSQSSDTQMNTRLNRQPTNTLRPRSGKEYQNIDPVITSMYKSGKDLANYTNIP